MSAAINAGFSLGFFLLVFGLPVRPFRLGAPDYLAFDFIPQSLMVTLMSALVPVLIERRKVSEIMGQPPIPVATVVLRALALAAVALVLGGGLAGAGAASPETSIPGWIALAGKLLYGAVLGAAVTQLAIRPRSR